MCLWRNYFQAQRYLGAGFSVDVKMVTIQSAGLLSGQQGKQLSKSSAPPEMQQGVIFVLQVSVQVALEAVR